MNYDSWGIHECWKCEREFDDEHQLVSHELTHRRLRKKPEGPTQAEVDSAIASIAATIKESANED